MNSELILRPPGWKELRGVELGLDEAFLAGLLERIHAESVRRQLEIVSH